MHQWQDFAMGPKLRAFLGIQDEAYAGHLQADRTDASAREFSEYLATYTRERAGEDHGLDGALLSDLLDELIAMDLPGAVLALASEHGERLSSDDFRAQLCIGVAAMMGGDLSEAEERFRAAQQLLPEEPAPYVNLVQIFYSQGRADDAELWAVSGLDADPNNFRLWELVAVLYRDKFGDYTPDRLLQLAEKRASWAGLSLAASLTTTGDRYLKLSLLDKLYFQGERDPQFLIELTAAMGVAGELERIPQIVLQAERLSQKGLPWQLHAHCAQASLALRNVDDALVAVEKARKDKDLPDEGRAALDELVQEAREALAQEMLH